VTATVPLVPVDPALSKRLTTAARKAEQWRSERDRLIVEAVRCGGGIREVARLAGLTHPSIIQTMRRAEAGADVAHGPSGEGSSTGPDLR
jgi:hypothetical protein